MAKMTVSTLPLLSMTVPLPNLGCSTRSPGATSTPARVDFFAPRLLCRTAFACAMAGDFTLRNGATDWTDPASYLDNPGSLVPSSSDFHLPVVFSPAELSMNS